MSDLIDIQAAIEAAIKTLERMAEFETNEKMLGALDHDGEEIMAAIMDLPTAKPEHKTGHWTREERPNAMPTFTVVWRCSVCGDTQSYGETKYCPNCGAKMEGKK